MEALREGDRVKEREGFCSEMRERQRMREKGSNKKREKKIIKILIKYKATLIM